MRDAGGSMQWVNYGMFRMAGDESGNTWLTDNVAVNLYLPLLPAKDWKITAVPAGDEWGSVSYSVQHWEYVPLMVPSALWEAFARYNQSNSNPMAIAQYTFDLAKPFRGEPFKLTEQELIDATPNFYNVHRPQTNSGYTEGSNYRVIAAWCVKDALNAKGFNGDKWLATPEIQAYIATGAAEGMQRWQATQEDDGNGFGALLAIVAIAAVAVATGGGGLTALLGETVAAGEVAAGAALTATETAAVVEAWSIAEYATAVSTQAFAAEVAASAAIASAEMTEAIYAMSDVAQNISTLQESVTALTNTSAELSTYVAESGDAVLELTSQQLTESAGNLANDFVNVSNTAADTITEIAELQTHVESVTQSIPDALQEITEIVAETPVSEIPLDVSPSANSLPPVTTEPGSVISEIAKALKISPSSALSVFKMLFAKTGGTPQAPTYTRRNNAESNYNQLLQQYQQAQENGGIGFDLTGIAKDLMIPALVIAGAYFATKGK